MASLVDLLSPTPDPREALSPEFGGLPANPEVPEAAPSPTPAPARSLTELRDRTPRQTPQPARNIAPPPSRGDDLLAHANAKGEADEEDVFVTRRVMQAQDLLQQKLDEDPAFAEKLGPELQKLHAENPKAYMDRLLDEADAIKIEQLKQVSPELFEGGAAFGTALTNTAMFGQLSRAYGLYEKLANGRDYKEAVEEAAETVRLLQKANPKASIAGTVAAYMIPGSPAKILFEKLTGLGARTAAPVIARVASNPGLLQSAIRSAAAGAFAAGGEAAMRGFAGQDLQGLSLDRSVKDGVLGFALGAVAGAGGEVVEAGARKVVQGAKAAAEDAAAAMSGVGADVLRASKSRFKQIGEAAGQEAAIGKYVANTLDQQAKAGALEVAATKKMLRNVPGTIDTRGIVDRMLKAPSNVDPLEMKRGTYQELSEQWAPWIGREFERMGVDPSAAPLWAVREVVDGLQDVVRKMKGYDKIENPVVTQRLLSASGRLNAEINSLAQKAGGDGVVYRGLMEKAAERTKFAKFLQKKIGKDVEAGGERLVRGLFGSRSDIAAKRMEQLDKIYGSNMLEQSKDAFFARQIGSTRGGTAANTPTNRLGWNPRHTTGKAVLGAIAGDAVAEQTTGISASDYIPRPLRKPIQVAGAVAGTALMAASSPRVARALLGASDKVTDAATKVLAEPNVLLRMASQPGTPTTVKQIAAQLGSVLKKDGPVSAAGAMRVIADTPYFFPFLHYHEIASRRADREQATGGNP